MNFARHTHRLGHMFCQHSPIIYVNIQLNLLLFVSSVIVYWHIKSVIMVVTDKINTVVWGQKLLDVQDLNQPILFLVDT